MDGLGHRTHRRDRDPESSTPAFARNFAGKAIGSRVEHCPSARASVASNTYSEPQGPSLMRSAVQAPWLTPSEMPSTPPRPPFPSAPSITDTVGPLVPAQALLPSLLLSPHPRIGLMSSRAGGIADDGSGGSYAYRASEAALNCIGKSRAVVLEEQGRGGRRDAP